MKKLIALVLASICLIALVSCNIGDNEQSQNNAMHAFMNKDGEYYYSFSTSDLLLKINELARKAGAFNEIE